MSPAQQRRGVAKRLECARSLHSLLQRKQRPSSLIVAGEEALSSISPPSSPKHHVAFRSHSAEERSQSTSLLHSLASSVLVSPASSLEKLNRLKDRLLRSVGSIPIENGIQIPVEGEEDSDDESTPLVSESSTPATQSGTHFLNRGFSGGVGSSNSCSSPESPVSIKTTPASPIPILQEVSQKVSGNMNFDALGNIPASDVCFSSSCGSSISLTHTLEPSSNYYHLVTVSGSVSSMDSGAGVNSHINSLEHLTDSDMRLSVKTENQSHLSRQDALDNSRPTSRSASSERTDDWNNPETTV